MLKSLQASKTVFEGYLIRVMTWPDQPAYNLPTY